MKRGKPAGESGEKRVEDGERQLTADLYENRGTNGIDGTVNETEDAEGAEDYSSEEFGEEAPVLNGNAENVEDLDHRAIEAVFEDNANAKKKRFGKHKPINPKKQKKSKKKKIIAIILVLVIIVGVVFGMKSCDGETVLQVSAEPASIMDIREEVSIKSTVEGSESAYVASALDNTITKINVKEGDRVKKGQVLAVLDGKDLQSAYDQAKSQYEQTKYALQDTLKNQQNEYDAAIIALNEAKVNYDANKKLYEEGAISQNEFMKYENDYLTKQASVSSFNTSGGKVTASAAQTQAVEVERMGLESKRDALDDINIKSPIDGTVTRVYATLGRLASETGSDSKAMFVIENVDNLEMNVKIGENDINKLQIGQPVTITSEVLGTDTVAGVVTDISPTGEEQNNNGNVEMVIPVKIQITEKNENLIAGVTAKAVILVNEAPNALAVPIDSIMQDMATGDSYVLVMNGSGMLEKRVIETGLEGDFYVEVASGDLEEGDSVVLNAALSGASEGMTVTVV